MSPAEAKLMGFWAPVEGMKTDALVLQPDERVRRQKEAADLHWHWKRLRQMGFFSKAKA